MIVVDASAMTEMVLMTRRGLLVNARLSDPAIELHAPHLLAVEVAHALRGLNARGDVSPARGEMALRALSQLPIRRWDHEPLLPRVWQLRSAITAYDAIYVALAEVLDATVLTTDARLGRSSGHQARIEVVTT